MIEDIIRITITLTRPTVRLTGKKAMLRILFWLFGKMK
jgi:hypothetical protein